MKVKAHNPIPKTKVLPIVTDREKAVLQLLAKGYTDNEMGELLYISPWTVKDHRKNLLTKFNARNTANLVFKACAIDAINANKKL